MGLDSFHYVTYHFLIFIIVFKVKNEKFRSFIGPDIFSTLPPDSSNSKSLINSPVVISHSFTVPSSELVTTSLPMIWMPVIQPLCFWAPANVWRQAPVDKLQILAVVLSPPLQTSVSPCNFMCPVLLPTSVWRQTPFVTSHTLIEPLSYPVTTSTPLNLRESMRELIVRRHSPVTGSQILMVSSNQLLDTTTFPSNWTRSTGPVCPERILRHLPSFTSYTRSVRSQDPETATFPCIFRQSTGFVCPSMVWTQKPVSTSQTFKDFS